MLHTSHPYIAVMKMGSGEEIIGKVVAKSASEYRVSKPIMLVNTPQGIQFAPLLMMAHPDKDVSISGIVAEAEPEQHWLTNYQSAVSGIALPQNSSFIGG